MPINFTKHRILRTKLHRPALAGDFIARDRLYQLLDQTNQHVITLVTAPAGYGKSSLISSWLEKNSIKSVWISLDEDDDDLQRFIAYIIAGLEKIKPDGFTQTLALLNAPEPPSDEVLFYSFINDLDEIKEAVLIVLDDYHTISCPVIHKLLTKLIDHPPGFSRFAFLVECFRPFPC